MILYDVLNEITARATQGLYEEEVKKAREEYFARTGNVTEEDPSFETRMSLFLEWYLFDRPWHPAQMAGGNSTPRANGHTPMQYFVTHPPKEWEGEELTVLESLKNPRHSIFEFTKVKENTVSMTDFADKKKLEVIERRGTTGFLKGAILEARLLVYNDKYYFSGPMLFHPPGAKKFIKGLFKKATMPVPDILFMLSAMALKCDRYKHVPYERIYSEGEGSGNLKL